MVTLNQKKNENFLDMPATLQMLSDLIYYYTKYILDLSFSKYVSQFITIFSSSSDIFSSGSFQLSIPPHFAFLIQISKFMSYLVVRSLLSVSGSLQSGATNVSRARVPRAVEV